MLGLRAHDFAGRDCGAIQGFLGAMRLLGFRATLAACRNHISICEEYQNGDPGRTRTLNLLIRSQLLYPVELRGRWGGLTLPGLRNLVRPRPTSVRREILGIAAGADFMGALLGLSDRIGDAIGRGISLCRFLAVKLL